MPVMSDHSPPTFADKQSRYNAPTRCQEDSRSKTGVVGSRFSRKCKGRQSTWSLRPATSSLRDPGSGQCIWGPLFLFVAVGPLFKCKITSTVIQKFFHFVI